MELEIIEENMTFDEILEDEYYKAEFEKKVQERLKEQQAQNAPQLTAFEYKVKEARRKAGLQ